MLLTSFIRFTLYMFHLLLIQPWFSHRLFIQTLSSGSLSVFNGITLPSHYLETECVLEREGKREREHVALKSLFSFSPLSEKSSNRERERQKKSKLSLLQLDFSQTRVLECISSDTLDVTAQLWSLCTEGNLSFVDWACVCEACVWQERARSYVRCYTERFWETRILLQTPGSHEATETAQPLQE